MATLSLHQRLLVVVGGLTALTLVAMAVLWPRAGDLPGSDEPALEDLVAAEVRAVGEATGDPDPVLGTSGRLLTVEVELRDGPDQGERLTLEVIPEGYPEFAVGDRVLLDRVPVPDGEPQWFIVDFERRPTLALLLGLFVLAVLAIGRWHGLRSLLGLALSLLIVVRFIVPAILAGSSPPLVALVGALVIMVTTLYLTHGVNEMTTAAIVGTGGALLLTVGLALVFVDRAKVTGYASDDANLVRFAVEGLDLQGLVLAGLIIAALGVLDDVTISQSSTVFALHDTDRTLGWSALFARAMRVGRDHIASVVNTLFLAYAGASLVLLVLFTTSGLSVGEVVGSEVLAEEIVKTVVGSLGLIAAVPFTTALAASVAVGRDPDAPPLGARHAHHGHGPPAAGTRRRRGAAADITDEAADDRSEDLSALDDEERAARAWQRYLEQRHPGSGRGGGDAGDGGSGLR